MQLSAKTRPKGFALLITITLLAFLVLLVVSLAALTRVETQVASNSQQLAQARQNALMALNIAVGELQKYAGPDQRTTARSDMDVNLADTPIKSGRWVAAYGRGVAAADATARDLYTDIPSKITTDVSANSDTNGNQAVRLNWLVSGNENTDFNPTTAVDPNGQIDRTKAPTAFAFTAYGAVSLTSTPTALSDDITIVGTVGGTSGTQPARLLVGPHSVTAPSDYVAAPLVSITAVAPGLGNSAIPIGRYAWWVGDEGAKARINLPMPPDKATAFVTPQRPAIELIDGIHPVGSTAPFSTGDLIGSAYNPAQANLPNVINTTQLPMLTPASTAALSAAVKYRYHDLTGYATSVLSDTFAGGLRKDLSAILATGASSPLDTDFIFPSEPNTASDASNDLGLPTWGQLRSFVQTHAPSGDLSSGQGLTPRTPTFTKLAVYPQPVATNVGVAPIMTYAAMGFRYIAPDGDVNGGRVSLGIYPMVVLWNPYTTDMLPAKYEVGIQRPEYSHVELQGHAGTVPGNFAWSSADVLEVKDLRYGNGSADPYFRFIINNTEGIPAGKSLVFTLESTNGNYTPANQSISLVNDFNPLYCVLLPSSLIIGTAPVPPAGGTYRVGVNGDAVRQPYNGKAVRVTYFSAKPGSNFEYFTWGGNGSQMAYLAAVPSTSTKPSGTSPYFVSAGVYKSREWYQTISWVYSTSYPFAPFGPNVGFPSDPTATTQINSSEGFPTSETGKWRGLLQSAGALTAANSPAWRMHVKARFKDADSRWIAQHNPRGFMTTNMKLMTGVANFTGSDYVVTTWPPINLDDTGTRVITSSGTSLRSTTMVDSTLFEFRQGSQPLMSLGQLQHANLGWAGWTPSYAIGNSIGATPFGSTPAALVKLASTNSSQYANGTFSAFYDQSWLLNRSLWDRYFVSTVPNKGTGTDADASVTASTAVPAVLPNTRHISYDATTPAILRDANKTAAHLLLSGGFNINSTSEQAWRSILAGSNQLSYDPTGANVGGSAYAKTTFSRFTKPTTNDTTSPWLGYRKLTDEQIAKFAADIVSEIRNRGPFVSMGDFINRRLYDSAAFPQSNDRRLKGTLQAALDKTTTGPAAINNGAATVAPAPPNQFNSPLVSLTYPNAFGTGSANGAPTQTAPYSATSAFAPQYLTQADVLSSIGSQLSARSDTFVIRTYGEVLDSVNSTATTPIVTGRAWCEAVIQRLPDYVNTAVTSSAAGDPADTAPASLQNADNKKFGRKFKIISFRWLSPNDI